MLIQNRWFLRSPAKAPLRKSPAQRPPAPPRPTVREVEGWKEQIHGMADVRWEKVQAIRVALAQGRYDVERRLNELMAEPPEDLAGTTRQGW